MDENSKIIENVQIKLLTISKDRQIQLSELKSYFDKNNKMFYKDIVLLNMDLITEVFPTKSDYRSRYILLLHILDKYYKFIFNLYRVENILSLTSSIGKILDLNNSIKTVFFISRLSK